MTGLFPGFLFPSSGLNRASTPVAHTVCTPVAHTGSTPVAHTVTTPTALRTMDAKTNKLVRVLYQGHPRPRDSPVSRVYDVSNSSTRLIITNNRLSKSSQGSRLRGQTDINGTFVSPDPARHSRQNSADTKGRYHQQCTDLNHRTFTTLASVLPSMKAVQGSSCGYSFPDLMTYSKYLLKPNKNKPRPATREKNRLSKSAPGTRQNIRSYSDDDSHKPKTKPAGVESERPCSRDGVDRRSSRIQAAQGSTQRQEHAERARGMSGRPGSGVSLLSLVLQMPSTTFVSGDIKIGKPIEETAQTHERDELKGHDKKTIHRRNVDKKSVNAKEKHTNRDNVWEINDDPGYSKRKQQDLITYKEIASFQDDETRVQEKERGLDIEKYTSNDEGEQKFPRDNKEIQDGVSDEFSSLREPSENGQRSEISEQQVPPEQHHEDPIFLADEKEEFPRNTLEDDSLAIAQVKTTILTKSHEEQSLSETDFENTSRNSTDDLLDISGDDGKRHIGMTKQTSESDVGDESDTE